jgi:hypothetical protein
VGAGVASAAALLVLVPACGGEESCADRHTCSPSDSHAGSAGKSTSGDGNEGGADGGGSSNGGSQGVSGSMTGSGGEAGGPGTGCTGDVSDDAACWTTNELGVFVSSDIGSDTSGDGTREKPYASITKGVKSAAGKNVYVCLGAADFYEEKLSIDASTDGVKIYGGFECENWTHDKARYVGVQSSEPIALRIQSLKKGVTIENVRFVAGNGAAETKGSSYGAFVTDSAGVVLRRVDITAGDGLKGDDGTPGDAGDPGQDATEAQKGEPPSCIANPPDVMGGSWASAICGSKGGFGGIATAGNGNDGADGIPTENVTPSGGVENGGPGSSTAVVGTNGLPGAAGHNGSPGEGASVAGTFESAGYFVASGKPGNPGFPGQGGGGGGASKSNSGCTGASGGAGGMGGCGGDFGRGGLGGGASIGLFSWSSTMALEACRITSGAGGAGGDGGKGGSGGAAGGGAQGGPGDVGNGVKAGGSGGLGGTGGNGGSGSGGTGGPSYALVFSGLKPSYTTPDTMLIPGDGGAHGAGGQVLDDKAPDGSDGDSAEVFEVP